MGEQLEALQVGELAAPHNAQGAHGLHSAISSCGRRFKQMHKAGREGVSRKVEVRGWSDDA